MLTGLMDPQQGGQTTVTSTAESNIKWWQSQSKGGKLKKLFLGIVVIIIASFVYQWISSPMIVTVVGVGESEVPASFATLSFTVTSTDPSASSAIASAEGKAESLRNFLKQKGASENDIVESQTTVIPASALAAGTSGYQASISMGVKTTNVTSAPELVATLYGNGASFVSQPIVSADNPDKLEQEAFDEALKDAKGKATQIALKNLKFIKKIVLIDQSTTPTSSTVTSGTGASSAASSEVTSPGAFKITKVLSVSYKMW